MDKKEKKQKGVDSVDHAFVASLALTVFFNTLVDKPVRRKKRDPEVDRILQQTDLRRRVRDDPGLKNKVIRTASALANMDGVGKVGTDIKRYIDDNFGARKSSQNVMPDFQSLKNILALAGADRPADPEVAAGIVNNPPAKKNPFKFGGGYRTLYDDENYDENSQAKHPNGLKKMTKEQRIRWEMRNEAADKETSELKVGLKAAIDRVQKKKDKAALKSGNKEEVGRLTRELIQLEQELKSENANILAAAVAREDHARKLSALGLQPGEVKDKMLTKEFQDIMTETAQMEALKAEEERLKRENSALLEVLIETENELAANKVEHARQSEDDSNILALSNLELRHQEKKSEQEKDVLKSALEDKEGQLSKFEKAQLEQLKVMENKEAQLRKMDVHREGLEQQIVKQSEAWTDLENKRAVLESVLVNKEVELSNLVEAQLNDMQNKEALSKLELRHQELESALEDKEGQLSNFVAAQSAQLREMENKEAQLKEINVHREELQLQIVEQDKAWKDLKKKNNMEKKRQSEEYQERQAELQEKLKRVQNSMKQQLEKKNQLKVKLRKQDKQLKAKKQSVEYLNRRKRHRGEGPSSSQTESQDYPPAVAKDNPEGKEEEADEADEDEADSTRNPHARQPTSKMNTSNGILEHRALYTYTGDTKHVHGKIYLKKGTHYWFILDKTGPNVPQSGKRPAYLVDSENDSVKIKVTQWDSQIGVKHPLLTARTLFWTSEFTRFGKEWYPGTA